MAFCSRGTAPTTPVPSATSPSAPTAVTVGQTEADNGVAGDVKNGPLEIFNVRVSPADSSAFYANPSGVYRVEPGVPLEFWVEWRSAVEPTEPPRLVIDWGFAEPDNIHCGPCKLSKVFPPGTRTVKVLLDDRVGGVTTRTFQIDAVPRPPAQPTPTADGCLTVEGVQWCFNPNACGQACNALCASLGLKVYLDDTAWFEAQNEPAECQAIAGAFGFATSVLDGSALGCLEDVAGPHTAPGGPILTGRLFCSTFAGCPALHRTAMDTNGVACGAVSRRSICPCG